MHLAECTEVRKAFQPFFELCKRYYPGITLNPAFIWLGMINAHEVLAGALSALHVLLWKFLVIDMVAIDEKSRKYDPLSVWKAAARRLEGRLLAHEGTIRKRAEALVRLGKRPPPFTAPNKQVWPLAHYQDVEHPQMMRVTDWTRVLASLD